MSDELNAAKLKIAQLEKELEEAKTRKQSNVAEEKLITALARLDALEGKFTKPERAKEDDEEEDGDQCPECGGRLYETYHGVYECSLCKQVWVEDEL